MWVCAWGGMTLIWCAHMHIGAQKIQVRCRLTNQHQILSQIESRYWDGQIEDNIKLRKPTKWPAANIVKSLILTRVWVYSTTIHWFYQAPCWKTRGQLLYVVVSPTTEGGLIYVNLVAIWSMSSITIWPTEHIFLAQPKLHAKKLNNNPAENINLTLPPRSI